MSISLPTGLQVKAVKEKEKLRATVADQLQKDLLALYTSGVHSNVKLIPNKSNPSNSMPNALIKPVHSSILKTRIPTFYSSIREHSKVIEKSSDGTRVLELKPSIYLSEMSNRLKSAYVDDYVCDTALSPVNNDLVDKPDSSSGSREVPTASLLDVGSDVSMTSPANLIMQQSYSETVNTAHLVHQYGNSSSSNNNNSDSMSPLFVDTKPTTFQHHHRTVSARHEVTVDQAVPLINGDFTPYSDSLDGNISVSSGEVAALPSPSSSSITVMKKPAIIGDVVDEGVGITLYYKGDRDKHMSVISYDETDFNGGGEEMAPPHMSVVPTNSTTSDVVDEDKLRLTPTPNGDDVSSPTSASEETKIDVKSSSSLNSSKELMFFVSLEDVEREAEQVRRAEEDERKRRQKERRHSREKAGSGGCEFFVPVEKTSPAMRGHQTQKRSVSGSNQSLNRVTSIAGDVADISEEEMDDGLLEDVATYNKLMEEVREYEPCSRLGQDLLRMLLSGIDSDVTIISNNNRGAKGITAHKCILAARSEYFASLLDDNVSANLLTMPDISDRTLQIIIYYIYGGIVNIPATVDLPELVHFATLYQLSGLLQLAALVMKKNYCHFFHKPCDWCISGVCSTLSICFNAASLLPTEPSTTLQDLIERCVAWLNKHYLITWPTRSFTNIMSSIHFLCISSISKNMSIDNILTTLIECNKLDKAGRKLKESSAFIDVVTKLKSLAERFITNNLMAVYQSSHLQNIINHESSYVDVLAASLQQCVSDISDTDILCTSYSALKDIHTLAKPTKDESVNSSADGVVNWSQFLEMLILVTEEKIISNIEECVGCDEWSNFPVDTQTYFKQLAGYKDVIPEEDEGVAADEVDHVSVSQSTSPVTDMSQVKSPIPTASSTTKSRQTRSNSNASSTTGKRNVKKQAQVSGGSSASSGSASRQTAPKSRNASSRLDVQSASRPVRQRSDVSSSTSSVGSGRVRRGSKDSGAGVEVVGGVAGNKKRKSELGSSGVRVTKSVVSNVKTSSPSVKKNDDKLITKSSSAVSKKVVKTSTRVEAAGVKRQKPAAP